MYLCDLFTVGVEPMGLGVARDLVNRGGLDEDGCRSGDCIHPGDGRKPGLLGRRRRVPIRKTTPPTNSDPIDLSKID